MKSSFRFAWMAGLIAVGTLFVVGCGGGSEDAASTSQTPSTSLPADAAPSADQRLVVQNGEPEFYDPHRSNFGADIYVARMMFRGLYRLVDDGGSVRVEPEMAASEPSVNGSVYRVRLKSGLKWSDGQPVTAGDFVYGIQRECDPAVAGPYQYMIGGGILGVVGCDEFFGALGTQQQPRNPTAEELQQLRDAVGVRALDDLTLEVTLASPKPTFTTIMSLWPAYPSRRDVVEKFGDEWTEPGNIVVNGPFVISGLVPGDHATFRPNPQWTLQPQPALQEITMSFVDDLEVALRAFQTGELNLTTVPAAEIPVIEGNASLRQEFVKVGSAGNWSLKMNLAKPPLDNPDVRLALSRAVDRESLVKTVFNDAYIPATYWIVEGVPGYQGNSPFQDRIGFNPDGARTALAAAGYPEGKGFPTLTITVLDRPDRRAEGEFLQKEWRDILGINVEIRPLDGRSAGQAFNSGNFELLASGWQLDYPDPENQLIGLFDTGGGNNPYGCSDPDIDAKLGAAATEADNSARIRLLQEAETLIVDRLCGVAPLYQSALLFLVDSQVGGVTPNGSLDIGGPGNWCVECWYVRE